MSCIKQYSGQMQKKKKTTMQALRGKTGAIGLKYEFLLSFLHIQEPTAITCTTRRFFFHNSMEIWYVPIYLRLTVCK